MNDSNLSKSHKQSFTAPTPIEERGCCCFNLRFSQTCKDFLYRLGLEEVQPTVEYTRVLQPLMGTDVVGIVYSKLIRNFVLTFAHSELQLPKNNDKTARNGQVRPVLTSTQNCLINKMF